jgi:sphingomyelin phosphodiesterase
MTTKWLFEAAAEAWKNWLPADALETVKQGGFYSVQVQPGFRIIAINSNLCYILNWYFNHFAHGATNLNSDV